MFERIDIGIKTFLRDSQLFNSIDGIQRNYPGARMIIADCGDLTEEKDSFYAQITREGHIVLDLPFDAGFGVMSNAIAAASTRPYLLIASDDFEFNEKAAAGLVELQQVLDLDSSVDIASGRVNNRRYEFFLDITIQKDGTRIVEIPLRQAIPECLPWYLECDLTVNYSLIRRKVFERNIKWDNDVKIGGGEHGAFFYDCKLAGLRTVCVEGVNINEQQIRNSQRYQKYRNRAQDTARPCFDKRRITEYVLGDGRVDYRGSSENKNKENICS